MKSSSNRHGAVKSITHNTSYILGGQGTGIAVRFAYVVLLTRFLGPELYGVLNYRLAWYLAFLPLTMIGLQSIILKSIGHDGACAAELVPQTFTLVLVMALSVTGTSVLLAWSLETQAEVRWLLTLFSVALVSRGLAQWAHIVQVAHEAASRSFALDATFRPLELLLGASAIMLGGGLWMVALIHCGIWLLQALVSLYLVQRQYARLRLAWHQGEIRRLLAQGIPLAVASACFAWFLQGPLIMACQIQLDPEALGQLALAIQILVITTISPPPPCRCSAGLR